MALTSRLSALERNLPNEFLLPERMHVLLYMLYWCMFWRGKDADIVV